MLLFIILSNLLCLLLPALTSAHGTIPEDPVNLAADHVKRLSNPLKNLRRRRDAILSAGNPSTSNALALNSMEGDVAEMMNFEAEIDIPGLEHRANFIIKGDIDDEYSVTVEFWVHYISDRRIGVFEGDLVKGVDMKIPESIKIISGEARLYVVASGVYNILVFEAYGSFLPSQPTKVFPYFKKEIKRWKVGNLETVQGVSNSSGWQSVSRDTSVDTS